MKTLTIVAALTAAMLSSCGGHDSVDYSKIDEAAKRDASKVSIAPEGSMQREHAVLAIKVRENALREAGHDKAADRYIDTARKILVDSLHIIAEE